MASSKPHTVQLISEQGHHCLSALAQSCDMAETAVMVRNGNQNWSKSLFLCPKILWMLCVGDNSCPRAKNYCYTIALPTLHLAI